MTDPNRPLPIGVGAVTVRRFGFELMPAGAAPSRTGIRGAWHGRPAPGDDSRYPVARGRVAGRCPLRAWAPTGARDGKQRRPVRRWRAANFAPAPAGAGQGGLSGPTRVPLHAALGAAAVRAGWVEPFAHHGDTAQMAPRERKAHEAGRHRAGASRVRAGCACRRAACRAILDLRPWVEDGGSRRRFHRRSSPADRRPNGRCS